MTTEQALVSVRRITMPDDQDLSEALIRAYDEVRQFFMDHPIQGASRCFSLRLVPEMDLVSTSLSRMWCALLAERPLCPTCNVVWHTPSALLVLERRDRLFSVPRTPGTAWEAAGGGR